MKSLSVGTPIVYRNRITSDHFTDSCAEPDYKLSLGGRVLGMLGESGKQLQRFGWIHEIACASENVLYVAELLNWRVQKLIPHPAR